MKKVISLSIILLIILLVYQLGINFIKQEHSVQYSINTKEGTYKIKEDYSSKDNDSYILRVRHDNHSYVFEVENEFNKQREIVKNIISYNKDDVNCISLEFVNKNINVEPEKSESKGLFQMILDFIGDLFDKIIKFIDDLISNIF